MSKGIIYVCSTAVDGLVKIGRTTDFESRMRILEDNGYRNVTGLKRQFAIEVDNHEDIEELLDDVFSKSRVGTTELFSLNLNQVIQLLSSLSGKQIYPTNETKKDVFEKATEAVQSKLVPDGDYYMSTKIKEINLQIKAKMSVNNGKFSLLKGSIIAPYKQFHSPSWIDLRQKMEIDNNGILQHDVECSSPSMAATIVAGRAKNGWVCWKNKNNEFINVYRNYNED